MTGKTKPQGSDEETTKLLKAWMADDEALSPLFEEIYPKLLAYAKAKAPRSSVPCQPEELVHRCYERLKGQKKRDFESLTHLTNLGKLLIRYIVVDILREKREPDHASLEDPIRK